MISLRVTGMTCSSCATAVERIIKAQDPQAMVSVDLAAGQVDVRTPLPAAVLAAAIEAAGYGAKPL